MTTARQVVTRALRKLQVLTAGEEPTSDELADCLDELNDMLAAWAIDGVDINVVTLAASDTVDLPADHISTVILCLADRVGGQFGAELSPTDFLYMERGKSALRALYMTPNDLSFEAPLYRDNLTRERG